MKNLVSLIFCSLLLNSAAAQIRVAGKVVSDEGALPGAHIWKKGNYDLNDVTDTNGLFELKNLTFGDTLICSFIGYQEKLFPVSEEDHESIIVHMKPYLQQLESVEVNASVLGAENFAFQKIEPIDIYVNPNSKADALVAINTQKSSTTKDENAAVAFRGASPSETGYFINGVPVKNPVKYAQLTNTGTLSIFNTDFLKSATVFPGNPPVEFGQATSGTIVLELADRFPDYWQHTASVSMANLGVSSRGQIGDKSYLGIFGNYQFDEILKGVNTRNFEDINGFNALEGGILFTTHQSWGSIKIYQYGLADAYNFNFEHPSHQGGFAQDSKRSLTTFQWVQEFGDWQASVIAGNSLNTNEFQFGNMDYSIKNADPYSSANLTYKKEGSIFKTGYAYWGQQSEFAGNVPTLEFALAPNHPSVMINSREKLESHELYLYGRKKWGAHAFGSGLRSAYLPDSGKQLWSYQFNYLWEFSERLKFIAGHGKYYQTRLDTDPQLTEQFQSSVDIEFKQKSLAIHQSFFRNHGNGAILGSESRMSFFFKNKIQLDQSASVYHKNNSLDWFARTFLKYTPFSSWTINASFFTFRGNSYRMVNSVNYLSGLDVFAPSQLSIPRSFDPYMNFSFGATKLFQFSDKLNGLAFINVTNIFDFKNENSISYNHDYSVYHANYLSRRSLYAGLIFNLVHK